ncbi:MAG: isoleucine--tRNA ligase [Actinomycetota bacterium]|nr:isoleucine--tRNA ligase [Actinomycetota bacterium]
MFKSVPSNVDLPKLETEISEYWDKINAFKISMDNRKNDKVFRFYDGPPFPTGSPHYGNLLAGVIKDIVPRYWTMRGYYVERRFGWDVHGLPIEMEVQKKLNLEDPQQIDEFGIDKFNEACRTQVQTNTENWEKITRKIGRWVDFENDYKTMDIDFMESVWWVFKELWTKGLIYKDYKVLPYSWAASTPLSNFEANMDYREVEDPSIFFTLKAREDFNKVKKDDQFLIWTTTPWCIPGNLAIAVGKHIEYTRIKIENNYYWIANERLIELESYELEFVDNCLGKDLLGASYFPAYSEYEHLFDDGAFRIIHSDDTNTESGSGLVSQAPAYGESDFYCLKNSNIDVIADPVTLSGKFDSTFEELEGINVKDADKLIINQLEQRGRLFSKTTEYHSYPYCWRTGTPLIYKAIPTWFVNVEKIKERMVELNKSTHWVPGFIGEKRFSNWLSNARDWAISRNRYWGSCIPIWINIEDPNDLICIGSVKELEVLTGSKITDLHRHYLDDLEIIIDGKTYRRTSEVLDCWFESGSMPYGQQHYPFENSDAFFEGFPADFIAEGLDQTRGWFYTLTVLAVALFDSVAFKNCITTGMILAEDGRKMSKSLKNYPDPEELLNKYGGDSLRAYLIDSPVVRGEPLKFSEEGVKLVTRNIILPLWNSFSFFSTYANADKITFEELKKASPVEDRALMDQWIISSLQSLIKTVNEKMENYYLYEVIPPLLNFVDELTNWYVRSNRKRFWKEKDGNDIDKINAFKTLHEVLLDFSKCIAPVLPFTSEKIYQGLTLSENESVHFCSYPEVDENLINNELEESIEFAKKIIKSVRNLRVKLKLPNKQSLESLTIISNNDEVINKIKTVRNLISNEINVKNILFDNDIDNWVEYKFKPNYKNLGPKLGSEINKISKILLQPSNDLKNSILTKTSVVIENIEIQTSDIETILINKVDSKSLEIVEDFSIYLNTDLNDDLLMERLSREIVSAIQKERKNKNLNVSDRIRLNFQTKDVFAKETIKKFSNYINNETLSVELNIENDAVVNEIFNYKIDFQFEKLTNNS